MLIQSKQEIEAVIKGVDFYFLSYYNYIFTFSGKTKCGLDAIASVGGNSHDIYKLSLSAGTPIHFKSLDDLKSLTIWNSREKVFEYESW